MWSCLIDGCFEIGMNTRIYPWHPLLNLGLECIQCSSQEWQVQQEGLQVLCWVCGQGVEEEDPHRVGAYNHYGWGWSLSLYHPIVLPSVIFKVHIGHGMLPLINKTHDFPTFGLIRGWFDAGMNCHQGEEWTLRPLHVNPSMYWSILISL